MRSSLLALSLASVFLSSHAFAQIPAIPWGTGFEPNGPLFNYTETAGTAGVGNLNGLANWPSGGAYFVRTADFYSGLQGVVFVNQPSIIGTNPTTYGATADVAGQNTPGYYFAEVYLKMPAAAGRTSLGVEMWGNAVNRFGSVVFNETGQAYLRNRSEATAVKATNAPFNLSQWMPAVLVFDSVNKASYGAANGQQLLSAPGTLASVNFLAEAIGTLVDGPGFITSVGNHSSRRVAEIAAADPVGAHAPIYDDIYIGYSPDAKTLRGRILLQDFVGTADGRSMTVTLTPSGGGTTNEISTTLSSVANGDMIMTQFKAIAPADGTYDIAVKVKGFLTKNFYGVIITDAGAFHLSGSLKNGDVDNDGEVGPGDFEHVVNLFGSNEPSGDVDGDGEVGPSDFEIVVNNFGLGES